MSLSTHSRRLLPVQQGAGPAAAASPSHYSKTLRGGHLAIVDLEDMLLLSSHSWQARSSGSPVTHYVVRECLLAERQQGSPQRVQLHRELLGLHPSDTRVVDHINGNALDNRRSNLRICTVDENRRNRGKHAPASSAFKGVAWQQRRRNWRARIALGGQAFHLGCFRSEEEAAKAYDEAALRLFGEFARLNFPEAK